MVLPQPAVREGEDGVSGHLPAAWSPPPPGRAGRALPQTRSPLSPVGWAPPRPSPGGGGGEGRFSLLG